MAYQFDAGCLLLLLMKSYFIRLFNYDQFANKQIADLILNSGRAGKPVELMAHLLAAQQIWLNRCKGLPAPAGALWPNWPAETFNGIIESNHQDWIAYLEQLQPDDFEADVVYKNSRGEAFKTRLDDVLAHLINHGTHHRAQAGQQLKFNGLEQLPVTDYIFYIRD